MPLCRLCIVSLHTRQIYLNRAKNSTNKYLISVDIYVYFYIYIYIIFIVSIWCWEEHREIARLSFFYATQKHVHICYIRTNQVFLSHDNKKMLYNIIGACKCICDTFFFPRFIGVHLRTYNFITWVLTISQPTTKATSGETWLNSHSVHPPCFLQGGGVVKPPTKFSKKGGAWQDFKF